MEFFFFPESPHHKLVSWPKEKGQKDKWNNYFAHSLVMYDDRQIMSTSGSQISLTPLRPMYQSRRTKQCHNHHQTCCCGQHKQRLQRGIDIPTSSLCGLIFVTNHDWLTELLAWKRWLVHLCENFRWTNSNFLWSSDAWF